MSGSCSAVGGRRRRSRTRKSSRKYRGGNGHGFEGETIGTAGIVHSVNNTSSGKAYTPLGGRRRKSRKSSRRSRKHRGGGSASSVGASFTGKGIAGMADVEAYNANPHPGGVQSA